MGALLIRVAAVASLLLAAAPAHAIRPTDGDGWFGNGYEAGVPVLSYPSPGGEFKVWWVESSIDAVQPGDLDADGIPDFVEAVAEHADAARAGSDSLLFLPPLDDSVYHDTPDFGGDGRYDIYLQNLSGTDGYRVAEVCTNVPYTCSGYFVMENDFAGFSYPSDDVAIRILTSHEFFHAIQDAYDADQDRKWTEGTAVWFTEKVDPDTGDFEGFLPYFLDKPERPFDRFGGAIGDLYPYGAALWARYLEERFGEDVIRAIWIRCVDGDGSDPDFLEATDAELATHGSSLVEAWVEFTRWNLFTAGRADPARAYLDADGWPSVRIEPEVSGYPLDETLRIEGMSARYLPIQLEDRAGAPARLTVSVEQNPAVRAAAYLWDGTALGDEVVLEGESARVIHADLTWTGSPALYVVVTGVQRGALPIDVRVELADPPPPPDPEPVDDAGCGCRARGGGEGGAPAALLLAAAAALVIRRRGASPPWLIRRPGASPPWLIRRRGASPASRRARSTRAP